MPIRKLPRFCINSVLWITLLTTLITLLFNCSGVIADKEEDKDVVTSKVVSVDDKSEKMIGFGRNVDRRASRVKLFDDIFNVN